MHLKRRDALQKMFTKFELMGKRTMLWKRSTKIHQIRRSSIKTNRNKTSINGLLWAFGSPGTLLGILSGILLVYFGVYFWDQAARGWSGLVLAGLD